MSLVKFDDVSSFLIYDNFNSFINFNSYLRNPLAYVLLILGI